MNAGPNTSSNHMPKGSSASSPATLWARDTRARAERTWTTTRAWIAANTFTSAWLPERWRHPALSYILAAVVQLAALGTEVLLLRMTPGSHFHEALLLLGVLVVSLAWGAAPGLFVTVLTILILNVLILPPLFSLGFVRREDVVGAGLILVVGGITSVIAGQSERARRAAHLANERMDQFLNVVSHELRSPIASLKGNVQFALRQLGRMAPAEPAAAAGASPYLERATEALKRTEQQVDRMNRMVADLLEAARVDTGKIEIHPIPFDLGERLGVIVEEQRQETPGRFISMCRPEAPVIVRADPDRVEQVILNYLSNAVKYSAQDTPIEVMLAPARREVRVAVRDHGPGLTAEHQEHVWQRGYRAKEVPVYGAGSNLGLGLYISRMLIEEQGGRVGVESTLGEGSTFWFTLPLVAA